MDKPICNTCPYWNHGMCQRHAPRPTWVFETRTTIEWKKDDADAFWPETGSHDWCGEHPDFPEYIASLKQKPKPIFTHACGSGMEEIRLSPLDTRARKAAMKALRATRKKSLFDLTSNDLKWAKKQGHLVSYGWKAMNDILNFIDAHHAELKEGVIVDPRSLGWTDLMAPLDSQDSPQAESASSPNP